MKKNLFKTLLLSTLCAVAMFSSFDRVMIRSGMVSFSVTSAMAAEGKFDLGKSAEDAADASGKREEKKTSKRVDQINKISNKIKENKRQIDERTEELSELQEKKKKIEDTISGLLKEKDILSKYPKTAAIVKQLKDLDIR